MYALIERGVYRGPFSISHIMIKKLIKYNITMVTSKPKLVLLITAIVTIISLILASTLTMDLSWVSLAPKGHATVEEYKVISENFSSMDNIIVVIESKDKELLEVAANQVSEEMSELSDYVENVNIGIPTEFLLEKGLLYYPPEELEALGYMFIDPNIDTFYMTLNLLMEENTKLIQGNDLNSEELAFQTNTILGLNHIIEGTNQGIIGSLSSKELHQHLDTGLKEFFVGNGMLTSSDGEMTMVTIVPSFSITDMNKLTPGVNLIEETLKSIDASLGGVSVRGTGMHIVARDEMVSVSNDSQLTTVLSFLLILVVLYLAFRSFFAPLLSFLPLIFGIIWALGITRLTVGRLNMITAFCSAMLLGLGIDYAIHMYSSYSEKRANGYTKVEALSLALEISGPGIIIGAMTTAIAFFALNVSSLEVLSELGTVMGTGIVTTLLSVFWLLPALIMIKKEKESNIAKIPKEFKFIGSIASFINKKRLVVVIILAVLTAGMISQIGNSRFDTNLMNLEPKGLDSVELMHYIVDKYDMSADSFSVSADSLEEVYRLHDGFKEIDGVYEVSSVADVIPKDASQEEALEAIEDISTLLDYQYEQQLMDKDLILMSINELISQLDTYESEYMKLPTKALSDEDFDDLRSNLDLLLTSIEKASIEDLNTTSEEFYETYLNIGNEMLTDEKITIDNIPDTFRNQFVSKDGKQFLITIVPNFDIWSNLDSDKGEKFINDLVEVEEGVTGTPFFMKVLYESAGKEMGLTGLLLFSLLFSILLLHFRSIKVAILAFLPLLFTLIFMVGIMAIIDLPFNMMNFLSVLLVIGIGLDDGVHILHHYMEGERNLRRLFSVVGRAIFLTTVTTVVGFGSMGFSSYRGIASLGIVLAIGVTLALIMTVVVLPIFLKDE